MSAQLSNTSAAGRRALVMQGMQASITARVKAGVDLTETASFAPLLAGAQEIDGPTISLTDNEAYCAFARFCDNGHRIWNEVQMPGEQHVKLATYMAHHCPSGRLIVWDNATRQPIETPQPAALSLLEDHLAHCVAQATAEDGPLAEEKLREANAAIARLVSS